LFSGLTAGATGGALSFLGGAGSALVQGGNPISGGLGALGDAASFSNITQGFSEPTQKITRSSRNYDRRYRRDYVNVPTGNLQL
jgi:hypothetical protein